MAVKPISYGATLRDSSLSFPSCFSFLWFFLCLVLCLMCVTACLIFNSSLNGNIPSGLIGSCWPHDYSTRKRWRLTPYWLIIWLISLESFDWCAYLLCICVCICVCVCVCVFVCCSVKRLFDATFLAVNWNYLEKTLRIVEKSVTYLNSKKTEKKMEQENVRIICFFLFYKLFCGLETLRQIWVEKLRSC